MSKLNSEKPRDGDGDYEIVSFEDFCDKSPGSKTDLLTLNDNINYKLCFEGERSVKLNDSGESGDSSLRNLNEIETSLCEKGASFNRKGTSFGPFGRHASKPRLGPLLGVLPKPKGNEDGANEPQYARFGKSRAVGWECSWRGGVLALALLAGAGLFAYWAVTLLPGGGELHPKHTHYLEPQQPPLRSHYHHPLDKSIQPIAPPPEIRYHDHNNLSTKNKNATVKKELAKKNSKEMIEKVTKHSGTCSNIAINMRFDCFPQPGANEHMCLERGCCWNTATGLNKTKTKANIPYCYYPDNYETFHFVNMSETKHGIDVFYETKMASGYPDDFEYVKMSIKYLNNDALHVKIYDPVNMRYDPPYPDIPMGSNNLSNKTYRVVVESSVQGFKIIRCADNVTIMDTSKGGFILSNKFLQISSLLPSNNIYGLGEHRSKFKLDMNWQTRTLFNFDTPPIENMNLYGTHPFYLNLEDSGKAHGVVLINSNAMDIVLQPTPAITYRTIGGILNFYVMLGPSPLEVSQQYYDLIGYPFLPPYWSLGFHLCKYNYGSLSVTRQVWNNTRNAGIPFDVQWNDLDYMNNSNDFTYDKYKFHGLPDFVKTVHKEGMKYMVLVDPGISSGEAPGSYPPFDKGVEQNVFVKNSTGGLFIGKVWNKISTVYPDFTNPNTTGWWTEMLSTFHKQVPFDGAWIDMNEPSNFKSGPLYGKCEPEDLPYTPYSTGQDGLKTKTLCMDAQHYRGKHYNIHNLYSLTEAIATNFAMAEIRARRPFVLSRSSFVGMGHYAAHWSGDVASDWHDMRMSIPEILNFNLFGVPMMGADICGFRGDTTPQLCKRWMQLGAFYPFSRNHNSDTSIPQDPVSLGPEVVEASRDALRLRYSILPYYYTLFWLAHLYGEPVVRPVFYHDPSDKQTFDIDEQFLIGPALMVAPLLYADRSAARAYFPHYRWCSIQTGKCFPKGRALVGEEDYVLIGGGNVITTQSLPDSGPITTKVVRGYPLNLLACEDDHGLAQGVFFSDDGDKLHTYQEKKYTHVKFQIKNQRLSSEVVWWGYGVPPINNITIYGIQKQVVSVTLDDNLCSLPKCDFVYDDKSQMLRIFKLSLNVDEPFSVAWAFRKGKKLQETITNVLGSTSD